MSLLQKVMRRAQLHVRHVSPVRPKLATGLVADVYAQVERDFGMLAPPISLHSPAPGVLAACWLMLRESLLAGGVASRAEKEAVATAVSAANSCPYCVEVHSASQDRLAPADEEAAVAAWVREGGSVPDDRVAEYVGVAVTFEYLNRMVNVFLPESPFPAQAPETARRVARKVLGRIAVPGDGVAAEPGASLPLLPAAPLPDDLGWARSSAPIAVAFARACAAFDDAGERSVPPVVRTLVLQRLKEWDGAPPGLSRAWADDAVADLPEAERAAGRLALLTALAAGQVGNADVAAVERGGRGPDALIELTGWASWAAARDAGRRYAPRRSCDASEP